MRKIFSFFWLFIFLVACNRFSSNLPIETTSEGEINISIEESFKPFMEEQLQVFSSSYPKAKIHVSYKSEIECLKDFATDSTRMIIITRGLEKSEQEGFKNQLGFAPTFGILAYNAIAVLLHKSATDSLFTLQQLANKLKGMDPLEVVMDGNNLTGVNRFLKDSLLKQSAFGKNVHGANGSDEVITYIKSHPNAIGFLGLNWVGDTYDRKQVENQKQVKTAMVECTLCAEKGIFAQPSQATIGKGQYSLSLPIYYILKENAPGLGSGFLNFLSLERGQLIFRRAFLVPAKMGFQKRNGLLN
ncbi:MAG: PstS family phosphate ABC transporter substrate-binding protein [Sediminibacterium sp.]